jgi:UDP-N-acetylmuramoyl-tripeptide--D-alanyl-D-alanine ligase
MIGLTLAEVAEATGGRLLDADPGAVVTGLGLDSRTAGPGELFVGLAGERADGADFAPAAVAAGAVAALVRGGPDGLPRIEVADPLAALTAVGGAVRARATARVVGVTGSSGKTITKDLTAAALATSLRTLASAKSFNNEIGLPLTLARLEPGTEALVVEMGARGIGHVAELCRTARPDVGVVTNVGTAHFEMFGSQANIALAKGELVEALPADGTAVLNADDPLVMGMAARTSARVLTYGIEQAADLTADAMVAGPDACFSFTLVTPDGKAPVRLPAPGEHLVADALAAAGAAHALGVEVGKVAAGLAAAPLSPMRMQRLTRADGVVVLNDAYNANPASMAAGLKALAAGRPPGGRILAVLGGMAELGPITGAEHERIGRLTAELRVDRLVTVGELGGLIAAAARAAGTSAEVVDDVGEVLAALGPLGPGDVVLVKASRAAGLDRAADLLVTGNPGEGAA